MTTGCGRASSESVKQRTRPAEEVEGVQVGEADSGANESRS